MFDYETSRESPFYNSNLLRIVDLATGKDLEGYSPLPLGKYRGYMVSEDFSMFVALSMEDSDCQPTCLHLVDIPGWKMEKISLDIPFNQDLWFPWIDYDKAKDRVLIVSTERIKRQTLYSYSVTNRHLSKLVELEFAPQKVRISPDRSKVYLYGTRPSYNSKLVSPPWVASFDLEKDQLIWQAQLPDVKDGQEMIGDDSSLESIKWWSPATVFHPDGDLLWVVHAHDDQLTTVDFSLQTIETKPILPPLSWIEKWLYMDADIVQAKILNGTQKQAVPSPDGKQLFVLSTTTSPATNEESDSSGTGQDSILTILDPTTGTIIRQWETEASRITSFPQGSAFYLTVWEQTGENFTVWTEIYQMDDNPLVIRMEGYEMNPSYRLDGSPILVSLRLDSTETVLFSVFDIGADAPFMAWEEKGGAYGWVIQPQP